VGVVVPGGTDVTSGAVVEVDGAEIEGFVAGSTPITAPLLGAVASLGGVSETPTDVGVWVSKGDEVVDEAATAGAFGGTAVVPPWPPVGAVERAAGSRSVDADLPAGRRPEKETAATSAISANATASTAHHWGRPR
jgi:hypothetical protein